MFYGNRAQQKHSTKYLGFRLDRHIIHRKFQFKYVFYLIFTVGVGSLIFLAPAYYFLTENYNIMANFAFKNNPSLITHLEQETVWLKTFIFVSFLAIISLSTLVAVKMTRQLIKPLIQMERHMRSLMLGDWSTPDFDVESIHDDDDFRDLSVTYDYLHRTLKTNMDNELKLLYRLSIDPQNRDAYLAWKKLIKIKQEQLGISPETENNSFEISEESTVSTIAATNETSESVPVSPFWRRAA